MISADVSCRLLEIDYAGIEAILTGLLMRHIDSAQARAYIRLARMGVHAAVTARAIGKPADFSWPDDQLAAYLREIKNADYPEYDPSKRTVHGNNYGLTVYGMVEQFPETFPDLASAKKFQQFYYDIAPTLPVFHADVRKQGREMGFLGGPTIPGKAPTRWDHPYGYRHWFWDVLSYQPADEVLARKWLADKQLRLRIVQMHGRWFKIVWGGDSKRVIAFYPQSIAAGVLKRAEIRLFHPDSVDYIGDAYFGRTPLLGPIHDSLFLHVPNRVFDRVASIVARVMQDWIRELPIPEEWNWGPYLRIGVDAKTGRNWDKKSMEKLKVPQIDLFKHDAPSEDPSFPIEDDSENQEVWDSLQRMVA